MSRKHILKVGAPPAEAAPAPVITTPTAERSHIRPLMMGAELPPPASRSPVGALGQSLDELQERSRNAAAIEQKLAQGQVVLDLDPASVEPSFVQDRMEEDDAEFQSFVDAIEEEGQQTPILVRPHPDKKGVYQVAFGHRRRRAALKLGRPVRAIVREMTDRELVVAQGQENNERQNLSFIERARFAQRLSQTFPRDVILSALAVYKSDLSNMLSVVNAVPDELINAIGPAHGIGLRRWLQLSAKLSSTAQRKKAKDLAESAAFKQMPSKNRFEALLAQLLESVGTDGTKSAITIDGREMAQISQSQRRVTLTVDRKSSPDFAEFLLNEVPRLFELHTKRQA